MLEQEFKYFIDNQKDLVSQYNGKHLLIVGEKVEGAYRTEIEAILDGRKKFGLGNFLVQFCEAGKEAYTVHYHDHFSFA